MYFFCFGAAFMIFSAMCVVINFGFVIFQFIFLLTFLHREHSLECNKSLVFSGGGNESRFKLRFLMIDEE